MPSKQYIDQLGATIVFEFPPRRIISLVPSQTELLFHLGLSSEMVGVTTYCIHPAEQISGVTKVGGTKNFDFDVIESLHPDLIIGNKEENYQEGIYLLKQKFPVWMSDVNTLSAALQMIREIGKITDKDEQANVLIGQIQQEFQDLPKVKPRKTLYLIWRKPWMAAGKGTFINDVIERIGLTNAIDVDRYPKLDSDQLIALNPDLVLLSSEPFPFREKHIDELRNILPHSQFMLVDGEMFSWHGSRLLLSCEYFKSLSL